MTYENFVEIFGIFASFIILISLLMSSVKKLRIINLFGSMFMFTYGFMISALPVMIMNVGILTINLFYLRQMFTTKDYFKVISVDKDDEYLKNFILFYDAYIKEAMGRVPIEDNDYRYFILRNMNPAGLFMARKKDEKTLEITLDFVTPRYRDFKTGMYVFNQMAASFRNSGYERFVTRTSNLKHMKYLKRMHFDVLEEGENLTVFTKKV
jgi:hypothetical protein